MDFYKRLFLNFYNLSIKFSSVFKQNKSDDKFLDEAQRMLSVYLAFFICLLLMILGVILNINISPIFYSIIVVMVYFIFWFQNAKWFSKNALERIKQHNNGEFRYALYFVLLLLLMLSFIFFMHKLLM